MTMDSQSSLTRWALGIEYDGGPFCGWQSQPDGHAIQDHLERALAHIAGAPVRVTVAGRTDAGVHASGQVLHFDTATVRPLDAWVRGVNTYLPPQVAVLWAQPVAGHFDARRSALARHYRYFLLNRTQRPGLMHGRVGWHYRHCAVEPMREAASLLIGEHDFSAFRASACQAKTPFRRMDRLEIRRDGDMLVFDLVANAFLHHMVRNIVGSLLYVGDGRRDLDWFRMVFASRNREIAAPTFMGDGLYLGRVEYPPEFAIPVRELPELGEAIRS